jgi:hypothetical protein
MIVDMRDQPRRRARRCHHAGVHHVVRDDQIGTKGRELRTKLFGSSGIRRLVFARPRDGVRIERGIRSADPAGKHAQRRTAALERGQDGFQVPFRAAVGAQDLTQHKETHRR